ncbi:MAG: ACP S-malonyltransferase [Bacteroidetes bacterium]|nr:ACP S-malonyltransferase [Bacteroidota bacterium]MCH8525062.1 ACP S-malonyltransferase [Balneolales bacterium]
MAKAYLFPGQGSQFVGMGKDAYDNTPAVKGLFNAADEILGISLTTIMFDGPEDKLRQTEYTQPAIFLHSVAIFQSLGVVPDSVAGHSLGEFSALVACGAVSFEDALLIVRKRGELMQRAGAIHPGTMAAVIGVEDAVVEQICADVSNESEIVVPANYNCPGQLVISGHETAIDRALVELKSAGCKIAKKLPVSGAFHSPLMKPAYDGLQASLLKLRVNEPTCPIYSNYTAQPTSDPSIIQENLLQQLMSPVKWTQTLQNMHANGMESYTEVGPGKVLQGLVKRTLSRVEINGYE